MRTRPRGVFGGLATACTLALAACGGNETTLETVTGEPRSPRQDAAVPCLKKRGYEASESALTANARRDGATGAVSVLLDLEAGSAADNVIQVYYWDSKSDATRYVEEAGEGPLGDLHHEQLGAATITFAHHEHGAEEHDTHGDVDAIAECVA